MSFRRCLFASALALSAGLGLATRPLVGDLQARLELEGGSPDMAAIAPGLGRGITVAALGGYRSIAANLVWIGMYEDWRWRRRDDVLSKISLAVALNPLSRFFWIDGARIIAYDMPVWEVGDEAAETLFTSAAGQAVRLRHGSLAMGFLDQAPAELAGDVALLREKAVISWQRLADVKAALGYLEAILDQGDAPYYLSRVYAELLIRDGRLAEARAFLLEHQQTLPEGDPKAASEWVQGRIDALDRLLEKETH